MAESQPAGRRSGFGVWPMEEGDIPQVAEIEREAFPEVWPPTSFRRELTNPLARYLVCRKEGSRVEVPAPLPSALGRLLVRLRLAPPPPPPDPRDLVVGYVGLWFLADEAHIISIAVRRAYRGRGLGELLLLSALELSVLRGARYATLEVRVSNRVAQGLYAKYGFQQVGLRPRYYADNGEDAFILTVEGIDTPAYRERLRALAEAHRQRWGDSVRIVG